MSGNEKHIQYALKIAEAISKMLSSEGEHSIDQKELDEEANSNCLIHALANVAPSLLYNQITGESKTPLEFNHLANKLCFEFSDSNKAFKIIRNKKPSDNTDIN